MAILNYLQSMVVINRSLVYFWIIMQLSRFNLAQQHLHTMRDLYHVV